MIIKGSHILGRIVFRHFLSWSFFIAYEILTLHFLTGSFVRLGDFLYYYLLNILLFYTHIYFLNKYVRKGGIAKIILAFAGYFSLFILLKAGLDYLSSPATADAAGQQLRYLEKLAPRNIFRNAYFCILATFYWLAGHVAAFRSKALEAEKRHLVAESESKDLALKLGEVKNAYLQQQLNPHMLFNTLNFVYSSIQESSADGARCVLMLSDILRYGLDAGSSGAETALTLEAEQLHNLIDINRLRFNGALFLETGIDGDYEGYTIIPLVLLTLTENVFKHGNLKDAERPAIIWLSAEKGQIVFFTSNYKKSRPKYRQLSSLGLKNIKVRLLHTYGERHRLAIKDDPDRFEVTLTIY